MAEPRSTFGPVVLLGAAAGTLAAVASSKVWVEATSGAALGPSAPAAPGLGEMPLASALSLVLLACWGVVLVTRGRVRRGVAGLAAVAALGVLATWVVAMVTLPDQVLEQLRGDPLLAGRGAELAVQRTGWFWAAGVGALLSVAATAAAVRLTPTWPEMGSRYDAPAAETSAPPGHAGADPGPDVDDEATSLDLWRAMDEGRDPTA